MDASRSCSTCGAAIPAFAPDGHCPACLLRIGLGLGQPSAPNAPASPRERIRYLGDYELVEQVASGGMGVVFRARQLSLNRLVAVKMIRAGQFANETDVARFRREAEAAAQLDHPNIVPIYEVGEHHGHHYFSMKLIEGGSLAARLARPESPLPFRDAAKLVAQISRAVHYAHQRGILHRDLKPGNILLDADGHPQVTDFGLAGRVESDSMMTLSGAILGTPAYMAPEQAAGRRPLTTAADIHSLGAVLYEILTGQPPFRGASVVETLVQVRDAVPVPPRRRHHRVPRDLETICLKCLEKDPDHRYASADALAEDLERWLDHRPIRALPVTPLVRVVKWMRRKPALATVVVALHLVGILGLAGILWQWREAAAARDAAKRADHERREQLWSSLGQQAHYSRKSGQVGQRTNALAAIAAAAAIRPSVELRNDALAALMLPDLGPRQSWKTETWYPPWCFDPLLEHYFPHVERGPVTVRASDDHRVAAALGDAPAHVHAAIFSPDGRFLAVRFGTNDLRVAEWRSGQWLAQVTCCATDYRLRHFDFAADSRTLYFSDRDQGVSRLALDTGGIAPLLALKPAGLLRVSPSARRLLAARGREVEIWELDPPRRLTSTNMSDFPASGLLGAAWHPSEELIALGVESGLHLWHWRSGGLERFGPGLVLYPYAPVFNHVGDLLFEGGTVWEVATRRPALSFGAQVGGVIALSRDEHRLALGVEKRGFGIWQFLPRLGTRVLIENPFASVSYPKPDVSSDGRRLATAHGDGWRVWDVATGRVIARGPDARVNEARFTSDGEALITVGADGLNRWPLGPTPSSEAGSEITVGPVEVILADLPSGPVPDTGQPPGAPRRNRAEGSELVARTGTVTHGGHFAALAMQGYAVVADVARSRFFPRIQLLNPNDVELALSPDGRWLVSGRHNRNEQDVWEVATGKLVTQIREPTFPACQFDPVSDALVAWNNSEVVFYEPGVWTVSRRFAWPGDSLIIGLYPGSVPPTGSILWCHTTEWQHALLDANTGRVVARHEHVGGMGTTSLGFDAQSNHAYAGTAYNVIRHFDLGALRRELARLGLDWSDENPAEGFAPRVP